MSSRLCIIYVPGLGDHYNALRRLCLRGWKLWGIEAVVVNMAWYDGKHLNEAILPAVDEQIKEANQRSQRIVLVGESAGAAVALYAASRHRVDGVITICGVTQPTTPISKTLRHKAPALYEAVRQLAGLSLNVPVVSLRAWIDPIIKKRYSIAPHARPRVVWSIGHLFTVILCLTLYAPYVISVAKKQSRV